MTIEELFGTLQQSVVAGWRKHLKTYKYSTHSALDEFYNEMPEKVDALIEAWMGANSKKINSFTNILVSKNMGTLAYLKELRRVVKQGYELMNGENELEALLDDIVELIDSTLYKVKELSESKVVDLKDFLTESLDAVNESMDKPHSSKAFTVCYVEEIAALLEDGVIEFRDADYDTPEELLDYLEKNNLIKDGALVFPKGTKYYYVDSDRFYDFWEAKKYNIVFPILK